MFGFVSEEEGVSTTRNPINVSATSRPVHFRPFNGSPLSAYLSLSRCQRDVVCARILLQILDFLGA